MYAMTRNALDQYRGLAKRRRDLGLTQHSLSRLTGIPLTKLTFAESGRADLTVDEVATIQKVLKERVRKLAKDCGK